MNAKAKRGQQMQWKDEARKVGGEALVEAIVGLHDGQKETFKRLDKIDQHNEKRDAKLAELMGAFPNGDVTGHCRYHTTMIEMLEERRRLVAAVKEKTISGLVWSIILGIGWSILTYVKLMLK